MMINNRAGLHIEDDDLIRLLDGEADPSGSEWSAHIDQCLGCSERLQELEYVSQWVSAGLPELDSPVDELARARALAAAKQAARSRSTPVRRRNPGWTRAAAAALILVAVGMSVQPVRAWVLDRMGFSTEPPAIAAEQATLEVSPVVTFAPTEATFVIEAASQQVAGTIRIEIAPAGAGASAQILNGGIESLSILPAGLIIDNSASSVASYTVRLPAAMVESVQVMIGGQLTSEFSLNTEDAARRVELATGTAP